MDSRLGASSTPSACFRRNNGREVRALGVGLVLGEMRVRFLAEPRNGGEGPWIMEERSVALGNREVLTLRGHPSLDPSSASG